MPGGDHGTEDLRRALRAGVAVYNVGEHHAAHDAWEAHWLDLDSGTDDERLLHGLIQFTAAVYHARRGNWSGARKLAASAREYLDGLPADHRGVDVASLRNHLTRLHADPERVERGPSPDLTHQGTVVSPADLSLREAALAADVVAEEYGYDESVIEDAARFASEADDPEGSRLATFLRDFVGDAEHRAVVFERMEGIIRRERREERDVDGLFESEEGGDGG